MKVGDFAAQPVPPAARQFVADAVHAAPAAGLSFTGCCDRTMAELLPYDRISRNPDEVSCGRLSETDERILTGRPLAATQQSDEQLLFELAMSVRTLCGPAVSLPRAYRHVRTALAELATGRDPHEFWSPALLVRITTRAIELAGC
jgi:hypothetical protein